MSNPQQPDGQHVMAAYAEMVRVLGPRYTSEAQSQEALGYALQMEMTPDFAAIYACVFDDARTDDKPDWGIRLWPRGVSDPKDPRVLLLMAPKRLALDPQDGRLSHEEVATLGGFLATLGAFTSPIVRATMALHGYRIEFVEIAGGPGSKQQKSPLLV